MTNALIFLGLALIVASWGAVLRRVLQHPPKVVVNVPPISVKIEVPPHVLLQLQQLSVAHEQVALEPLPERVAAYTSRWHDEWARQAANRHARELYAEVGDWSQVLQLMQQEDEGR